MNFAKTLKSKHLFIIDSVNVARNVAVYKTKNGPIFAVFADNTTVQRYIFGSTTLLTSLECSHDLRDNSNAENETRLCELLGKCFSDKNVVELRNKIKKATRKITNAKRRKK